MKLQGLIDTNLLKDHSGFSRPLAGMQVSGNQTAATCIWNWVMNQSARYSCVEVSANGMHVQALVR